MKKILLLSLLFPVCSKAQVLDRLGRKLEQKVIQKAEQAIDKSLDKKDKKKVEPTKESDKEESKQVDNQETPSTDTPKTAFSVTSKFDFVQGDKVIFVEDFGSDAIGDFPAKWNTNASAEIVNISGTDNKWIALTTKGIFLPEFINSIPENATIEFDLMVSPDYSYYDSDLQIALVNLKEKNDYLNWPRFGGSRNSSGVVLLLHPQGAGSQKLGRSEILTYDNGKKIIENRQEKISTFNHNQLKTHVAIWRQNQRIRVYVGEQKIWDLPRAFNAGEVINSLVFSVSDPKPEQNYFVTNIRVAAGAPDTRHKLMETGSFSTSGIRFKINSSEIIQESHGVIKEIADVMKENQDLKIKIVGHTDASGNDAQNQTLSEKRAESVKNYLKTVFSIDEKRMKTEGKGSFQPISDNSTDEGKANNRRVEFVKE